MPAHPSTATDDGAPDAPPLGGDESSREPLVVQSLHLPAPCAGIPYSEQLAAPGRATKHWRQVSAAPRDLRFDPATATLSGTPVEGGLLRVAAEDAETGVAAEYSIDLSLRDNCWFAELTRSAPEGPAQLHLRDVFLTHDVALGAGAPVSDFEFSPDGASLAFRAGPPEQQQLFLYAVPDVPAVAAAPTAQPITFDCAGSACTVLEYAWSPDSRRLAVALRDAAGNDHVAALDRDAPAAPVPSVSLVTWLIEQAPLQFSQQLTWGGPNWFGFWGLEGEVPASEYEVFHVAFVVADQPLAVSALVSEFGLGPRVRAIPAGLALSYADSTVITALVPGSAEASVVPERARGVLSPSGHLVGFASEEGRLQLNDLERPDAETLESERGACSQIVAWSQRIAPNGVERILCTAGSELRVLDYVAGPAGSAEPARVEPPGGTLLGAAGNLVATRRAFSPSGRFLLLGDASSGALSLIDLFTGSTDTGLPFQLPAEIAFAPTRDALALANAQSLIEYSLPRSLNIQRGYSSFGGAGPAIGAACEESFWQDPSRWCGAPEVAVDWRYSTRSQSMLLEGRAGALSLIDLSVDPQRDARALPGVLPTCPVPCRREPYAFRPQAAVATR